MFIAPFSLGNKSLFSLLFIPFLIQNFTSPTTLWGESLTRPSKKKQTEMCFLVLVCLVLLFWWKCNCSVQDMMVLKKWSLRRSGFYVMNDTSGSHQNRKTPIQTTSILPLYLVLPCSIAFLCLYLLIQILLLVEFSLPSVCCQLGTTKRKTCQY